MPAVKDVGEPCAGELHARFEVAGAGNGRTRPWRVKLEACRETGRPYADRLPSTTVRTAPAPDPTSLLERLREVIGSRVGREIRMRAPFHR